MVSPSLSVLCMYLLCAHSFLFAHIRECDLQRGAMSSPSDLMTLPFLTRQSHVFRSNLVVDNPNTALSLKKQNLNPMWKKLMKLVDLGEPTSFLDHVYLGCTQCECKSDESILEQYKKIFESRVSTGATEQLLCKEKSDAKTVAWSYDMEGHTKKCVEIFSELENRKAAQLYEVSTPCLDDHHVKKGRTGKSGRIVTGMLSNCHEMLMFGPKWVDLTLFGLCTNWHELSQNGPQPVTNAWLV